MQLGLIAFFLLLSNLQAEVISTTTFKTRITNLFQKYPSTAGYGNHHIYITKAGKDIPLNTPPIFTSNHLVAVPPASNMKIVTSTLALDKFGANFKFKTNANVELQKLDEGKQLLKIELIGSGDPTWMKVFETTNGPKDYYQSFINWFITIVQKYNLTKNSNTIKISLNDTKFKKEFLGPWTQTYFSDCYSAETAAFNVHSNCDLLKVIPPESSKGKTQFAQIYAPNYMKLIDFTTLGSNETSLSLLRNVYGKDLYLKGRVQIGADPFTEKFAIHHPTNYLGQILKGELQRLGFKNIEVVESSEMFESSKVTPEVFTFQSANLSEIVFMLNKVSSNQIAEILLKSLGFNNLGEGVAGYARGLDYGQRTLKEKLNIDIATSDANSLAELASPLGYNNVADGSGLSRYNFLTTATIAQLLSYNVKKEYFEQFYRSLPVAGDDGTLRNRMKNGCYRNDVFIDDNDSCKLYLNVRAKTGSISHIAALSGYIKNYQGILLAFSFITSDFNEEDGLRAFVTKRIHEQILAELYWTQLEL